MSKHLHRAQAGGPLQLEEQITSDLNVNDKPARQPASFNHVGHTCGPTQSA
jgi:hypothetical protein